MALTTQTTRERVASRCFVLLVAAALWGCDAAPATTDAGRDSGASPDAPVLARDGGPEPTACLAGSVCTLGTNAGCSGPESCAYAYSVADGARTNECIAPGTRGPGESCAANSECSAGHSCLGGFCVETCCPTAPSTCAAAGASCAEVQVNVGGDMTDTVGLCACTVGGAPCPADSYCEPIISATSGLCLRQGTCSRLTQDCPADQGCYGTIRACLPVGVAAENDPCTRHSDCGAGLWCRPAGMEAACTRYCEVGGAAVCPAGSTCMSFGDDEPTVGGCYPM